MNKNRDSSKYKNLILKRARQHKLLETQNYCVLFNDLPDNIQNHIVKMTNINIDPVLVFLKNINTWTLLGENHVFSKYNDSFVTAHYQEIHGKVKMVQPDPLDAVPEKNLKFQLEFILLAEKNVKIWAPPGSEYFALMNMFKAIR